MTYQSGNADLEAKVEARIQSLLADKRLLARFDTNGDDVLDPTEWAAVRRVVTEEILAESVDGPLVESFVVADRFELISELGRGAQGHTHLARDRTSGDLIAVKILNIADTVEWKHYDLIKREGEVLKTLNHEGIPTFVDLVETEIDSKPVVILAQEYIPGDNLEFRLMAGELFDEARLIRIATNVLLLLNYLHDASPPIVHRDVKPANIIMRGAEQMFLVDFGAVQFEGKGQDTIVGTLGYMPPEQLMSRPVVASDLYSLGATLIHLATRKHPGELESERMKLQWRGFASLSEVFSSFIEKLVEPVVEDRFLTTREALQALAEIGEGRERLSLSESQTLASAPKVPDKYANTDYQGPRFQVTTSDEGTTITLPTHLPTYLAILPAIGITGWAILWLDKAVEFTGPVILLGLLFALLILIPAYRFLVIILASNRSVLVSEGKIHVTGVSGWGKGEAFEVSADDYLGVERTTDGVFDDQPSDAVVLRAKTGDVFLHGELMEIEVSQLRYEIENALASGQEEP